MKAWSWRESLLGSLLAYVGQNPGEAHKMYLWWKTKHRERGIRRGEGPARTQGEKQLNYPHS